MEFLGDQEIFLLRTAINFHFLNTSIAQQFLQFDRGVGQGFHRAKKRGLHVKNFTGPGEINGRDDQSLGIAGFEQESRTSRVPGGIPARLKGRTDAAGRKT